MVIRSYLFNFLFDLLSAVLCSFQCRGHICKIYSYFIFFVLWKLELKSIFILQMFLAIYKSIIDFYNSDSVFCELAKFIY